MKRGAICLWIVIASLLLGGCKPLCELFEKPSPTYRMKYDGNGNTAGYPPIDDSSYLSGSTVTVLGNTGGLSKTDHLFSGWNTVADGSGTSYAAGASLTMPAMDITLYAQWAVASYSIAYLGNGNTDGKAPTDDAVYLAGSTAIVLGNNGGLWKSGYLFAGWNTRDDGSGTSYAAGDTITMAGSDLVLYARWVGSIDGAGLVVAKTPYFNALAGKIYNVYPSMEYSLDDGSTWSDCAGSEVSASFSVGDKIWVRIKSTPAQAWYLGQVSAGSDSADLIADDEINLGLYNSATNVWTDIASASVGGTHWLHYSYNNQGATVANQTFTVDFYLSTDRIISTEDTPLFSNSRSDLSAGPHGTYRSSFTVPSLPPGTYYVGCILDATNAIVESNEGNNVTFMEKAAEFTIKDDSANASSGAFKFVNSWGTGTWQNKTGDGHYWITYESMKTLKPTIYYYKNTFYPRYSPTIIAVFKLTHPYRDKTKVTLALASDKTVIAQKEFQSRSGDTLLSGALPYPDNELALDISEFAQFIDAYDLYLVVENGDATAGTLDSFRVEFLSRTNQALIKTTTGSTGAFPASGAQAFSAPTRGCLSGTELDQVQPQPRLALQAGDLVEDAPEEAELGRDMARTGVYEAGRNYNERFGGFGTGFAPPTREEWASMRKLRSVNSVNVKAIAVDQSVDNSKTVYFPPIGNQGKEGSCTAWAFAYYVHTYTMAREFGWDLSQAGFGGASPGAPLSDQNRIMSPDFVYHQINSGVDDGCNIAQAGTLLARIGCATWDTMPYSDSDHSSWPTLDAYKAAAKYRASEANAGYWEYKTTGYFVIEGDAEINLLKSLLESGYCVVTSIRAGSKSADDNIYHYLSPADVISATSFSAGAASPTNHAQTIVGFKDGAAWDPLDPDS